jgi:tetratricopeptide (TPR) repeat protein
MAVTGDGDASGGSYTMGFQMHPATAEDDISLDGSGVQRNVVYDRLYKLACDNREKGNKEVQAAKYNEAIGRYSEAIMQLRSLENEQDIKWDDAARLKVRELRAAAYLNLSLCFIKKQEWTHAVNTSTRALQGDKDPPDPNDAVLPPDKRAKALFRRAQARCEGFGNFDEALTDLRKALDYVPEDKAVEQMLRKCEYAVKKTSKKADKKMAGFLKQEAQSGEGLFDDSLRPDPNAPKPKQSTEPMKVSDGLWLMPEDKSKAEASTSAQQSGDPTSVDEVELGREIAEIRETDPELYAQMREKVKAMIEESAAEGENADAVADKGDADEQKLPVVPPSEEPVEAAAGA